MAVRHHHWLLRLLVVGLTCSGAGFLISLWMVRRTRGAIFERLEEVPEAEFAIVLGAPVGPEEIVQPMLEDRLRAGLALYRSKKVQKILLTGHGETARGSETRAMEQWIRKEGVPGADLQVDPGGIRTFPSLSRAAWRFGIRRAVVCTQAFHLPRALWLARAVGLDAVGLVADRQPYQNLALGRQREFFGRQLAFLEGWRAVRRQTRPGSPPR
jgi:SanA protein